VNAMVEQARSWLKENQTLVLFLLAQAIATAVAGASMLAYFTKLETRVSIMETRGAEYTVARMNELRERITILEQKINTNAATIERLVAQYLKDREQKQ
jgi:hypothetical protein